MVMCAPTNPTPLPQHLCSCVGRRPQGEKGAGPIGNLCTGMGPLSRTHTGMVVSPVCVCYGGVWGLSPIRAAYRPDIRGIEPNGARQGMVALTPVTG